MVETKDKVTEQTTNISEQNVEEKEYCLLPLRDIVIFPSMIIPIFIGRGKSIATVEEAMKRGKQIVLVAQKDALVNNPKREDLFDVGVKANIVQMLRLQDNTVKLLVEATSKVKITNLDIAKPYWATTIDYIPEDLNFEGNTDIETLTKSVRNSFSRYIKFNKDIIIENVSGIETIESPILLLDTIIMSMNVKVEKKQEILEASNITEKLEKLYAIIETELDFMKMDRRIRSRVKQSIDKNQREFYLSEQMKAIQKELGDDGEDYDDLEKKIDKVGLSKEAYLKAKSEIKKLKNMSPQSPEYSILRNYLELLLSLPWNKKSELDKSISEAEKILDEEHYALEKVKERILEFLAVQKRVGCSKGTILCFMGPPGVGKTSLGRAIAKATGRVFEKLSLGGVHDEAEIRGHRRTYIGAQCGKILSIMKKAGVNNPLIMLDEIDKMGNDYRGDPASAMLEVLDPEQNVAFNDHYLDLDYDLSNVMFIATANSYNIPRPLLDRMEVIELSGYTEDEKIEIAKRHIIPKTLVKNGLDKSEISISDGAIRDIVRYYTRESGVRGLERQIDKMMRKSLRKIGERVECDDCLFELKEETQKPQKDKIIKITSDNITEFLGVKRFDFGKSEEKDSIGTVTGLAWTEVGGELLQIESAVMAGKGLAVFTGKLGDVMKESIETAKSFVRSHSAQFGINSKIWDKIDIHIHVPEGATPKDGPSAGIAMMTSIVSTLTEIPVRKDVAMTGEITLRGRVLPIGGLKEKLLAALRGGIKTVAIPFENVKDLEEIPQVVKDGLKIIPVKTADEVLKIALSKPLQPIKEVGDFFENLLKTPSKPQGEIVQ
ncbi:MAG: endopeptidase La [Alphaproteobacteria bacterium]|nr:endopeptidase La [Alphaproteobacteria bacterium]